MVVVFHWAVVPRSVVAFVVHVALAHTIRQGEGGGGVGHVTRSRMIMKGINKREDYDYDGDQSTKTKVTLGHGALRAKHGMMEITRMRTIAGAL